MNALRHPKSQRRRIRSDIPLDQALQELRCARESDQESARPLPSRSQSKPLTPRKSSSKLSGSRSLTDFGPKIAFPKGAAWTPTHEQWKWFHLHVAEQFDPRKDTNEQWAWFSRNRVPDLSEMLNPRIHTGMVKGVANTVSRGYHLFNRNRDQLTLASHPSAHNSPLLSQSGQPGGRKDAKGKDTKVSSAGSRKDTAVSGTFASVAPPSLPARSANLIIRDPDLNEDSTPSGGDKNDLSEAVLARKLGMPFDFLRDACETFKQFSNYSQTGLLRKSEVSMDDFSKVLCHCCNVTSVDELDAEFVDEHFRSADRDGSGSIDVEEFCIWHSSASFAEDFNLDESALEIRRISRRLGVNLVDVEKYHTMFRKFDSDGSGLIEYEEFARLLIQLLKVPEGHVLPPERVAGLWREADSDGGGEIDFEEFCKFYINRFVGDAGFHEDFDFSSFYKSVRKTIIVPSGRVGQ